MAATPVAVTTITRSGVTPVAFANSDNVNGNSIVNDGHTWIEVSNTDASTRHITVSVNREVDGQSVTPTSHAVTAGAQLRLGPFPTGDYGNTLLVTTDAALLQIAAYTLAL